MRFKQIFVAVALGASMLGYAQDQPPTGKGIGTYVRAQKEVGDLIREFLSKVNDPAMHERFWADDLIYTGSSGKTKTKAEILQSMRAEQGSSHSDEGTFNAEDMQIRQYGDTAVAAFRLVHKQNGKEEHYRNTGTFVKRNQWQAVAWQATRIQ